MLNARFAQNLLVMAVSLSGWAALAYLLRLLPARGSSGGRRLGLWLGAAVGALGGLVLAAAALLDKLPADFLSRKAAVDWRGALNATGPGQLSLWIVGLMILGAGASLLPRAEDRFARSAGRALAGAIGLTVLSALSLWGALLGNSFNIKYVAEYSRTTQPWFYKLSAFWGGQAGSLLFWALVLALYTALFMRRHRDRRSEGEQRALAGALFILSLTLGFFLALVAFVEQPFAVAEQAYSNGFGLNPLLQNPWMTIHPPMLYAGYIGCAIPFALAFGVLAAGGENKPWLGDLKHHALVAWLFLSVGIILGGWWAYITLGWGGYWAWDPVENASLLPWLTLTAFLHGRLGEARRGITPWLNFLLIATTYGLSLYGTFLTRSGILSSVHAFAAGDPTTPVYLRIGPLFLIFLGIALACALGLLVYRINSARSRGEPDGFFTRESFMLLGMLLITAVMLIVLVGVTGPIFTRQIQGVEVARTREWYDRRIAPVALALLLGMAVGPLLAWRRTSGRKTLDAILTPVSGGIIFASLLMIAGRYYLRRIGYPPESATLAKGVMTFLAFAGAGTVLCATLAEFWRGAAARRRASGEKPAAALWNYLRRSPDAFGGYIAHCGLAIMFIGFAASAGWQIEKTVSVQKGESFQNGAYTLKFIDAGGEVPATADFTKKNEARYQATVEARRFGGSPVILTPAKIFFATAPEPKTTVEIRYGLVEDLYLVFGGYDPQTGAAGFKTFTTPLVGWIWFGIAILAVGGLIALWLPLPGGESARPRGPS